MPKVLKMSSKEFKIHGEHDSLKFDDNVQCECRGPMSCVFRITKKYKLQCQSCFKEHDDVDGVKVVFKNDPIRRLKGIVNG